MSGLDNSQEVTDEVSENAAKAGEAAADTTGESAAEKFADAPAGSSADEPKQAEA